MDRIYLRKVKKLHANKVSCPWENVNNDVKNVHNGPLSSIFWMNDKTKSDQRIKTIIRVPF